MKQILVLLMLMTASCAKIESAAVAPSCELDEQPFQALYPDGVTRKSVANYCQVGGKTCATVYWVNDSTVSYEECQ